MDTAAVVEKSGVPREFISLNLALGRGVSYYTGLVFEIHAQGGDGNETQICGGGRYDSLVQAIGGTRPVKACGFAFGVERLSSLIPQQEEVTTGPNSVIIIPVSQQEVPYALQIARALRINTIRCEVDISGHGVGAALKLAVKKHIPCALIVGESEAREQRVTLRDLEKGEERNIDQDAAISYLLAREVAR